MQTVVAVVRSVSGTEAEVEVLAGGCGRCQEPGGCGGQSLTQAFCGRKRYRIGNVLGAQIGQRVRLGIDEVQVRSAANRAYLLPLVGLLGGALLGSVFGTLTSVAGATVGLVVAWLRLVYVRRDGPLPRMIGFAGHE